MIQPAVHIIGLTHRYGKRVALDDVSLKVEPGQMFALLGPNGSGKTTLFRILSTLIVAPPETVYVSGLDVSTHRDQVRRQIGVVFQSPSLDKQLTADENLRHHGHLYGLSGAELQSRIDESLERLGLTDRRHERVAGFSGGMRRRVEIAKGLLNRPRLLILDEPSTGLDPVARIELWRYLADVRGRDRASIIVTTHLMDEADRCDRLAILDEGKVLASDTPAALKERVGGDVITVRLLDLNAGKSMLRDKLEIDAQVIDGALRIERPAAHALVPQIVEALPGLVTSIVVGKPTLEDAFVRLTGRRFQTTDGSSRTVLPTRHA